MDTAVGLVKAYLELCGYFVLAELPVRAPGTGGSELGQGYHDVTDLDVLAVRFPRRHQALPGRDGRVWRPLEVFLGADSDLGGSDEGIDLIVGEVKEGKAQLNRALLRGETVAFALRRAACCPEEMVEEEALAVVREGERRFTMPGGTPCLVRLVAFAGQGEVGERGVRTVSLAHCARFINRRLSDSEDVLAGAQFKDPVLSLFALQHKISGR
jgi:hypothetical protein